MVTGAATGVVLALTGTLTLKLTPIVLFPGSGSSVAAFPVNENVMVLPGVGLSALPSGFTWSLTLKATV